MKVVDNKLKGYFINDVTVGADKNGEPVMPTSRQFVIAYHGLNKAQCVGLAANRFDKDFWLGVSVLEIANADESKMFDWSTKELVLPMEEKNAKKYCQNKDNSVIFYFE